MNNKTTVTPRGSIATEYGELALKRAPYLTVAKECALVTIPHLFPENSNGTHQELRTPFQSVGARGLNHIATKFMMTLMPTSPFFRLKATSEVVADIKKIAQTDEGRAQEMLDNIEGGFGISREICL